MKKKMNGNVFNIGSNKMNYSKKEICEIIKDKTNAYFHYADIGEDADKRNYIVSYDKINKIGYKTSIDVKQGIDELINAIQVISFKTPYTNI